MKGGLASTFENLIEQVSAKDSRRLVWSAAAPLWQWWRTQKNKTTKATVLRAVTSGQLEIVLGGFDEGVTHYQSTLDQLSFNLRRIKEAFGECSRPRVGWLMDSTSGHSAQVASLFSQLGFDGFFINRVEEAEKLIRLETKAAEFFWMGSKDLEIFTSILYAHYNPPGDFCSNDFCREKFTFSNDAQDMEYEVIDFISRAREQASHYKTKHILWPMGLDLSSSYDSDWYKNMDALLSNMNSISGETGVVAQFSTPSCYLQALHEANQEWSVREGDFLPYSSGPHSYWTGSYTARPTHKRLERIGNNVLQVCKQLHALGRLNETDALNGLRDAMTSYQSVMAGAVKQKIADDYANRLRNSMNGCDQEIFKILKKITGVKKITKCPLLNISACEASENVSTFVITIYNPLARNISKVIRIPVGKGEFSVTDLGTGKILETQMVWIPIRLLLVPGRNSSAVRELVFEATDVPAMGFKSFHVNRTRLSRDPFKLPDPVGDRFIISNKLLTVTFDHVTGFMSSVNTNGQDILVTQEMFYYLSGKKVNGSEPLPASGANIFRPQSATPETIYNGEFAVYTLTQKGPLIQVMNQTLAPWASQVIRLYKGQKYIEIDWLVGPIPTEDGVGKEVFSWFSTDHKSNGEFQTDSKERKIDTRNGLPAEILEPVAGNYYPVTGSISMGDERSTVAILVDRPQAGGSVFEGTFELMLHRRLVEDDGVGENVTLDEKFNGEGLMAGGRHILIAASTSFEARALQKDLTLREIFYEPTYFFTQTALTPEKWMRNHVTEFTGLNAELPMNVHVLTLEPWANGTVLMRLEHIFEENDHPELSKPVSVKLKSLFKDFRVDDVSEVNLGADEVDANKFKLKWRSQGEEKLQYYQVKESSYDEVTLQPAQIRTFLLKLSYAGQ